VGGCGYVTADYLQKHLIEAFTLSLPDERSSVVTTR
jgi:hypothetical protein